MFSDSRMMFIDETLATDDISPSDVESMRQEVKRDLAFLDSEVAEIKKSTEETKNAADEAKI
jgi:hypothetical protein